MVGYNEFFKKFWVSFFSFYKVILIVWIEENILIYNIEDFEVDWKCCGCFCFGMWNEGIEY